MKRNDYAGKEGYETIASPEAYERRLGAAGSTTPYDRAGPFEPQAAAGARPNVLGKYDSAAALIGAHPSEQGPVGRRRTDVTEVLDVPDVKTKDGGGRRPPVPDPHPSGNPSLPTYYEDRSHDPAALKLGAEFHRFRSSDLHLDNMDRDYKRAHTLAMHDAPCDPYTQDGWNVAPRYGRRSGIGLRASTLDLLQNV